MELSKVLTPELVVYPLEASSKEEVISKLIYALQSAGKLTHPEIAKKAVMEREKLMSTGVGRGVAIPHGKYPYTDEVLVCVGVSRKGVDFDAVDGQPVYIFVLLLTPEKQPSKHLKLLSKFSRILNTVQAREEILEAQSPEEIARVFHKYDKKY
ncbi:MAG TPA: PTS sugar transporter subunit IIA [Candidatus Marinimicrobia bacterium]|nr:PTS sugar transporter subunit IIA [Candidatus Neomarinimicrobiota bacterium]